jgi:hypothetical protein
MNDLLHNVWHDLREKRLWPIALVLLLAIVAVPVLLTQSAAQPPADEQVATATGADDRVTVKLDGGDAASSGAGSSLDEFAEGDPFTPPGRIARGAGTDAGTTATIAGASDKAAGGDGGGAGGVDSPPASTPAPPVDVPPPTTRTETKEYEYVADVTFWNGDRRLERRGVRKLDMLPNQSAPVLIFMGTSGQGGNAVFLVDSTLKAAGEGRCVPSAANCAYVHIGPGSEHAFSTEEGDSYRLRINEIRRVEVKASARKSASASAGDRAAVRRFELPSLADLVAVETVETVETVEQDSRPTGSSPAEDGR